MNRFQIWRFGGVTLLGAWMCAVAQDEKSAASLPPLSESAEIVRAPEPRLVVVPLPSDLRTQPEPIEPPILMNGGAGLLDPDFAFWSRGLPVYWYIAPAREVFVSRTAVDANDRVYSITTNGGYPYNFFRQVVTLEGPLGGKTLVFSADMQTTEPGKSKVLIEATYAGQKLYSSDHSGDGEWQRLQVEHTLPADFTSGTIEVGIVHTGDPKAACTAKAPRLELRTN